MDVNQMLREALVRTLLYSVHYWQQCTFKSKLELAEESGIWSIHHDRGSQACRTLDRYLNLNSLPARPNTEDVLRTAHFVLHQGEQRTQLRQKLEEELESLIELQQQLSLTSALSQSEA